MSSNKIKNVYICSNCDAQSPKWSGRCSECGAWGTLSAQMVDTHAEKANAIKVEPAKIIDLEKINNKKISRIVLGNYEIDRVFGGGILPGSLLLLAGEPGIGKSTLVAQIADLAGRFSQKNGQGGVFYASGEESADQVRERFLRLNCDLSLIKFISETNAEKLIAVLEQVKPSLVIIDSIQTVYSAEAMSEPGSITQIRACAVKFLELAKKNNIAVILIGHITKDGQAAGPKTLEHIVDAVVYLESEAAHSYRLLRATKNRFGSINEIGIFEMTGQGLKEISNPSLVFIGESEEKISGSVISAIMEGTRPFLVELQALVTKTVFGYPQRKASGFDSNRLQVLAAVISKRGQVNLSSHDIILNIVGGLRVDDPGLDLAACAAIVSSLLNQTIDRRIMILGEVGLGGEVRTVSKLEERLNEAIKLGFTTAILPANNLKGLKIKQIPVKRIDELIELIKAGKIG
jgi:DNA repair protein RadA/Sms